LYKGWGDLDLAATSQLFSYGGYLSISPNPSDFVATGHFLLLSPSPATEDSGSCDHHLTSPVLPASGELCGLQLAVFRSGLALGNLTLLVQGAAAAASSGAPLGSTVIRLRHTRGRSATAPVNPLHFTPLHFTSRRSC